MIRIINSTLDSKSNGVNEDSKREEKKRSQSVTTILSTKSKSQEKKTDTPKSDSNSTSPSSTPASTPSSSTSASASAPAPAPEGGQQMRKWAQRRNALGIPKAKDYKTLVAEREPAQVYSFLK